MTDQAPVTAIYCRNCTTTTQIRIPPDAWDDIRAALWDLPDTELAAVAAKLGHLADAEPGRAGVALRALTGLVETEQAWRYAEPTPKAA